MEYELDFLQSLLFTIIVETTVLLFIIKGLFRRKITASIYILLLAGIISSFATLPYFWFIVPLFIKVKIVYKIVCEGTAILIESLIIYGFIRMKYTYALLISTVCNLASYGLGVILL